MRVVCSFLLLLALGAGLTAAAEKAEPSQLRSPRLSRLSADLERNPQAVERFWEETQRGGTPLIEPIGDQKENVLVTFLWRGDAATRAVFVIALGQDQFSNPLYLERGRMSALAGTDVWFRTYVMRCEARFSYRLTPHDPPSTDDARPDPLNRVHFASRNGDSSVAELPCAPDQPAIRRRDDVPHGTVQTERFANAEGESHALQIYTPPRYESGIPGLCNLVVLVGGAFTDDFPVPTILDNLIADGLIPPSVVVSIGFDAGMAAYVRANRSDDGFARYVAVDLMAWIRSHYRVASDPKRTIVAGASAPGAGALFIAMRYPRVFANLLTQSGAYVYPRDTANDELMAAPFPEAEPLARELATTPRRPLRIYLAVGSMEEVQWQGGASPRYGMTSVLVSARHLRDVLDAKGYPLLYREYAGLHETLSWSRNFAEGLIFLNDEEERERARKR